MKVLIPFTCYPSNAHGTGAANQVFANMLSEMVKDKKINFVLLPVNLTKNRITLTNSEYSYKQNLTQKKKC